jgi:hypothetical protein
MVNDHLLIDQGIFNSLSTIKDSLQTMAVSSQKLGDEVGEDQAVDFVGPDNFKVLQAAGIQ